MQRTDADSRVRVSIVVATYCPGSAIDRLVASLDAQTMPVDEWEVIFVDDGSPDDTVARLHSIAEKRTNVRIEAISPSGWPCRPRNVGTDLAVGTYVLYMDHDDLLYPDALRAGYEFAVANNSDVVNGKEARTHASAWAIDQYRADAGQIKGSTDFHPLLPTNPHKLYRRAFLDEHRIRFREDGRVLWEDIFFNVLVAKHAEVISTLASTPFYHWYATSGSASDKFRRSKTEWWWWLAEVVRAIDDDLAGPEHEVQRDLLRGYQYRDRLMDAFNNLYHGRPSEEKAMIFQRARELQAHRFSRDDDQTHLNTSMRLRAALLRDGDLTGMDQLTVDDPNIPGVVTITGARWVGDAVQIDIHGEWINGSGVRHRLRDSGGRVLKSLPARWDGIFEESQLDVTDEIATCQVELGVRSRATRVTWMLPLLHSQRRREVGPDGDVVFTVDAKAELRPADVVFGKSLEREVWDVSGRATLGRAVQHRLVKSHVPPQIRLDADGVMVFRSREDGRVVLDIDQHESELLTLLSLDGTARRVGGSVEIGLLGISVGGDVGLPVSLMVNTDSVVRRAARRPLAALRKLLRRAPGRARWHKVEATVTASGGVATLNVPLPRGAAHFRLPTTTPGDQRTFKVNRTATRVTNRRVRRGG